MHPLHPRRHLPSFLHDIVFARELSPANLLSSAFVARQCSPVEGDTDDDERLRFPLPLSGIESRKPARRLEYPSSPRHPLIWCLASESRVARQEIWKMITFQIRCPVVTARSEFSPPPSQSVRNRMEKSSRRYYSVSKNVISFLTAALPLCWRRRDFPFFLIVKY